MSALKRRLAGFLRLWYNRARLRHQTVPPEVWIENTDCCNAHCVMCPREKLTRPLSVMSLGLFEKIIKELAPHADKIHRLHVHNYGEPLLDKQLAQKVQMAKQHGFKHVYFVTNASLLTAEKTRELIEAGLDEFKVSFYGTDRTTYNATMTGLDFDKVIDNLRSFFEIRRELQARKPKIVIQYLPQESNAARTDEFAAIFEPMIDPDIGDALHVFSLHNYGGGKEFNKIVGKPRAICDYPWRVMMILCDGRVGLCCLDFNAEQIVGDANKEPVLEIWNGPRMAQLREDFKRLDYRRFPICLRCDRSH